jgi:hypothetical protein
VPRLPTDERRLGEEGGQAFAHGLVQHRRFWVAPDVARGQGSGGCAWPHLVRVLLSASGPAALLPIARHPFPRPPAPMALPLPRHVL